MSALENNAHRKGNLPQQAIETVFHLLIHQIQWFHGAFESISVSIEDVKRIVRIPLTALYYKDEMV
jgi:hypothetical protein